jgi:hypothetical protein
MPADNQCASQLSTPKRFPAIDNFRECISESGMDSQTVPPTLPPKTIVCNNCGMTVPVSETITLQNAAVCAACKPIVVQRMKEGATAVQSGIWREDNLLVTMKEATLPDRCVKCNAPAQGYRLLRKLTWHPSGYYFFILLNLLIYAVVAMIVSKKAKVQIGLCPVHRKKRTNGLFVAWGLFIASVFCFTLAGIFRSGEIVTLGIICLIASPIYGAIKCRTVNAKRIDESHAWMQGACPEYLDSLPVWK